MIRAMYDARRRIGGFAQDDLRKNRDNSRTELMVFVAYIVLSTLLNLDWVSLPSCTASDTYLHL